MTSHRSLATRCLSALLLPLLLLVALARPAAAQTRLPIQVAPEPPAEATALLVHGEKLRLAGIIMTLSGAALAIAGGAVLGYGLNHEVHDQGFGSAGASLVLLGVGGGALATGGILWLVGSNQIWEARQKMVRVELAPAPISSLGAGLAVRF